MRVTPPLEITPARLTSATPTEPWAPAAYNGATTYALGDVVLVAADFAIYESLAGSNTGNTPNTSQTWWRKLGATETAYNGATTYALGDVVSSGHILYQSIQAANTGHAPLISPTWWKDIGATNKYRAIDLKRNTQAAGASPLTYVITPGERVNTCAVLGIDGDAVAISMTSAGGGGTVYSYAENLSTREVFDAYSYCFEPFSTRKSVVRFDLPPYTDGIITITVTRASGLAKIGGIVIGTNVYMGEAQYDAESDALNFSSITRDAIDGTATLVPRAGVPKTNQTVYVDKARVNKIRAVRDALDAVPAFWSAVEDSTDAYAEALEILGIYNKFTINIAHPEKAVISLGLEEI